MAEIKELPAVLADQIAAGEVIERPASVIKELVENALDAHSKRVDILTKQAGIQEIRVIDDGEGIAADQVPLAFKRHATSKIRTATELFRVQTMGFRGEALPSIASVADLTMVTAVANQDGFKYHIRGGEVVEAGAAASRPGTDVLVRQLFFNTPARLKYLKSPSTELSWIVDIVHRLALANPDVAISLQNDGKELFRSAGNGNLKQVLAAIYGNQVAQKMVAIQGEDNDFKIHGFVSLPEVTRASRKYQTLLINHRYVRNFNLTKAVLAGYGSKLMVGRYPLAVIEIDLDPFLVDVNVHPAKREVRLSKENQLAGLIRQAIASQLATKNLIPDVGEKAAGLLAKHEEPATPAQAVTEQRPAYTPGPAPFGPTGMTSTSPASAANRAASSARPDESAPRVSAATPSPEPAPSEKAATAAEPTPIIIKDAADLSSPAVQAFVARYQDEVAPLSATPATPAKPRVEQASLPIDDGDAGGTRFPQLTYIGQLHGTFLLAQASDGLYIIDQHAAQERINYERYRREIGEVGAAQQSFLTPLILNYPLSDAIKLRERQELLAAVGLKLEPFGQNSFMVSAHPAWLVAGQEEDTIKEMVEWVLQNHRLTVADFRAKTAIMMSCKRAIKANHHLDAREATALLARLPQCENPFNCPHGRPVLIHFTPRDLEKMFKRIQESHEPFADEFDDHED